MSSRWDTEHNENLSWENVKLANLCLMTYVLRIRYVIHVCLCQRRECSKIIIIEWKKNHHEWYEIACHSIQRFQSHWLSCASSSELRIRFIFYAVMLEINLPFTVAFSKLNEVWRIARLHRLESIPNEDLVCHIRSIHFKKPIRSGSLRRGDMKYLTLVEDLVVFDN